MWIAPIGKGRWCWMTFPLPHAPVKFQALPVYVISAEGDSINDVTELISEKLKQKLTKDNAKKTNLICSLEKQNSDSLIMSDVATSINKISEGIEAGTEIEEKLWYDFQNKDLVKKYKLVCVFSFI